MTVQVIIPKAGMGITEGTVLTWLKAEGDLVTEGETIVEIETAKVTEELVAPVTGVLTRILVQEGESADVAAPIAEIEPEESS